MHQCGKRQTPLCFGYVALHSDPPNLNSRCDGKSAHRRHQTGPLSADRPSFPPRFRLVTRTPHEAHGRIAVSRVCKKENTRYAVRSCSFWSALFAGARFCFRGGACAFIFRPPFARGGIAGCCQRRISVSRGLYRAAADSTLESCPQ